MTSGLLFIYLFIFVILAVLVIRDCKTEDQINKQAELIANLYKQLEDDEHRVKNLEELEKERTKREAELNAIAEQFQKAQKLEQMWQEGLENIQAYDMDTARKAVSGRGGE